MGARGGGGAAARLGEALVGPGGRGAAVVVCVLAAARAVQELWKVRPLRPQGSLLPPPPPPPPSPPTTIATWPAGVCQGKGIAGR